MVKIFQRQKSDNSAGQRKSKIDMNNPDPLISLETQGGPEPKILGTEWNKTTMKFLCLK